MQGSYLKALAGEVAVRDLVPVRAVWAGAGLLLGLASLLLALSQADPGAPELLLESRREALADGESQLHRGGACAEGELARYRESAVLRLLLRYDAS